MGIISKLMPVGAICGLALGLGACGGSSSSSSGGSGGGTSSSASTLKPALTGSGENLTDGKKGGTLTVYQHEDFQHLDPGEAYFSLDYEIIYPTNRTLYQFSPDSTTKVVPDLAAGPPVVTDGGKTVTVHIRSGVRFSPPVNRAVTSADVAYGIERAANPNVANPYFPAYFVNVLQGADKANGGPISGIQTPSKTTIVFHLVRPDATFFQGVLSLPTTAPIPEEFAGPLDKQKPTTYGTKFLVSSGPYMFKADSKGDIQGTGYQPGKSATLVRNPNWDAKTDFRPAYLDQININIGGDPNVIGRQTLVGSHTLMNDTPSGPVVKLAYQKYYNQLVAVPGAGDHYLALDNKTGPFANVNVRKALWAALNRDAMLKADGGQTVTQLGTHFLYPGSAGYAQAGGDHGPNVDYNNFPSGNMAVAQKYMKLAGFKTGKYTGNATVKIVGATGDPADKTAAIVNQAVQSLGLKTNFTLVDQPVMYGKYCGSPAQEIDACPNVGWIRDWSDPQTLLDPTFAGYNIVSSNNSNWGQVGFQDAPGTAKPGAALTPLDQAMKAAEKTVGDANRAAAWAKVDIMLVDQAVAVPWVFDKQANIESKDVRGINDLWNIGSWDYDFTSLK
jgi:peptide/nickel transport system substrate-binding protein